MNVWYCVCILIFLYSLSILIEEGLEVIYVSSDQEVHIEPVAYLSCFSLRKFYPNDSQVRLERLRFDLYDYFDNYKGPEKWKRKDWGNWYSKLYEELVLKRVSSMDYFIWASLLCLRQEREMQPDTVFRFFEEKRIWLAFNQRTFDRIELNHHHFRVNQLIVINRGRPYSNCLNGRYRSRFHCLNECLKKKKRLSKYHYDSHETGLVLLNEQDEDGSRPNDEQECSRQCDKDTCNLIFYFNNILFDQDKPETKIFKAIPLISGFEFVFQSLGLLCLVLGVSFKQTMSMFSKFASSRTRREKLLFFGKSTNFWRFLKSTLLLASLPIFAYLNAKVILIYKDEMTNPIRKESTLYPMQLEPLRAVICFTISEKGDDYFRNHTALEIEKDTDQQIEKIDQIFLKFQNHQTIVNYTVQSLAAFKSLSRCFQLEITPEESHYRSLLAISKLVIKFKKPLNPFVYLLTKDEKFSPSSFSYKSCNNFAKKVTKRTRDCKEYRQVYPGCVSRSW